MFDPPQPQQTSIELTSFPNPFDQEMENEELHALATEFVSRYLSGVDFQLKLLMVVNLHIIFMCIVPDNYH
ncbi:hypothetical protein CRYUN_Cryun14cG0022700 [Craigia yunnanensis]